MTTKIQDLTKEELQSVIESYSSAKEHNTIAKIIVELYQKELNERED